MSMRFRLALASYRLAKTDAQTRLREYALDLLGRELEFAFKELADEFVVHELDGDWHRWVQEQAWLFWQYKGAPNNQSKESEKDDYMQAQRYLGYLLAEYLLKKLSDGATCPVDLLKSKHVKYLVGLSIEEFVRFRAYFVFRHRTKQPPATPEEIHDESTDYDYSVETVRASLRGLLRRKPADKCTTCRGTLIGMHHQIHGTPVNVRVVKVAKGNAAYRMQLCRDLSSSVDKYVMALYPWLDRQLRDDDGNDASPLEAGKCLCGDFAVANIYEMLAMCPLAREVPETVEDWLPELFTSKTNHCAHA